MNKKLLKVYVCCCCGYRETESHNKCPISIHLSNLPYYIIEHTICKLFGHKWSDCKLPFFDDFVCERCYKFKKEKRQ